MTHLVPSQEREAQPTFTPEDGRRTALGEDSEFRIELLFWIEVLAGSKWKQSLFPPQTLHSDLARSRVLHLLPVMPAVHADPYKASGVKTRSQKPLFS